MHPGRVPIGWVGACIVPECPAAECRDDRSASSARQAIAAAERPGPRPSGFRPWGVRRDGGWAGDRQARQAHRRPRRPAPAGHVRVLSAIRLPAQPRGPDPRYGTDVRRHPDRDRSVRGHRAATASTGGSSRSGGTPRAQMPLCLPTAASSAARTRPSRSSWSPSTDRTRRWRSARTTSSWRPTGRRRSWSAGSALAGGGIRPAAASRRVRHPGLRAGVLRVVGPVAAGAGDVRRLGRDGRDLQHVAPARPLPRIGDRGSSTNSPSSRACSRRSATAMAAPAVPRSRTIVVYGRPGIPRNAFPAIVDGLRAWRASDPNAAEWAVISVGEVHPDIDLGGGAMLRSRGKLDLGHTRRCCGARRSASR